MITTKIAKYAKRFEIRDRPSPAYEYGFFPLHIIPHPSSLIPCWRHVRFSCCSLKFMNYSGYMVLIPEVRFFVLFRPFSFCVSLTCSGRLFFPRFRSFSLLKGFLSSFVKCCTGTGTMLASTIFPSFAMKPFSSN